MVRSLGAPGRGIGRFAVRTGITFAVTATVAATSYAVLPPHDAAVAASPVGIHKIQHVIVLMQENRSFDSYFGTFPGADGIPMSGGQPSVCVPDPNAGTCEAPYV